MIIIPTNTNISEEMKKLISFFNKLEENLQYPNSDGYADQRMYLENAEKKLKLMEII